MFVSLHAEDRIVLEYEIKTQMNYKATNDKGTQKKKL